MKIGKGMKKGLAILTIISSMSTALLAAPVQEKKVLDVEYAINMAISKDTSLAAWSRNISASTAQKEEQADIASLTYQTTALSITEMEQKKIFKKDAIAKQVTDQVNNMILLEKNIELLQYQIDLNNKQVKQAAIKQEKGYTDELSYEKAVQTLEKSKAELSGAKENLGGHCSARVVYLVS